MTPTTALPEPTKTRWQPLRLGLVEMFRYDSEEFWFRDGHLLLRGNNGTGKSKVLSLTLPLLLDANLRPARVEPDGDPSKKMAWNLLLGDVYERRTGYSWLELGRLGSDGQPQYLTLGLGLQAVAARAQPVEAWYFIVEAGTGGARLGRDWWLLSDKAQVPGREALRTLFSDRLAVPAQGALDTDAAGTVGSVGSAGSAGSAGSVGGASGAPADGATGPGARRAHGQVFEQAQTYRRAVDERLFQLGSRRYDALIDTLIQLRQPQLSRRPDERLLSAALTESLPPLPTELLADVAEAMAQLDTLRSDLERAERLLRAVQAFETRYRVYAGMASRRQARQLRQAQTEFDQASRQRQDSRSRFADTQAAETNARQRQANAQTLLHGARQRHETLLGDPRHGDARQLHEATEQARQLDRDRELANQDQASAQDRADREARLQDQAHQASQAAGTQLAHSRQAAATLAEPTGLGSALQAHAFMATAAATATDATDNVDTADAAATAFAATTATAAKSPAPEFEPQRLALLALPARRRDDLVLLRRRSAEARRLMDQLAPLRHGLDERRAELDDAASHAAQAETDTEAAAELHLAAWDQHLSDCRELPLPPLDPLLQALADWAARPEAAAPGQTNPHPGHAALQQAQHAAAHTLAQAQAALDTQRAELQTEVRALDDEAQALRSGSLPPPPAPAWRGSDTRPPHCPGAPLWQLVDFAPTLGAAERAGIEAALLGAGLLDAWVTPDGGLLQATPGQPGLARPGPSGPSGQHEAGAPASPSHWLDAQWLQRPGRPALSLARWLQADAAQTSAVPATTVAALLATVAAGPQDDDQAEAWVSSDGRFRLGGLAGQAAQASARHIGHAARQAARQQRLQQIVLRQQALAQALATLDQQTAQLDQRRQRARHEATQSPSEQPLLRAHQAAAAAARALTQARQRETEAAHRCRHAETQASAAQAALQADASDLRLPLDAAALDAVDQSLNRLVDSLHSLAQAVREQDRLQQQHAQQQQRVHDSQATLALARTRLADGTLRAEAARTRLDTLAAAMGQGVTELERLMHRARMLVLRLQASDQRLTELLRSSTEARAVAEQQAGAAETRLQAATRLRAASADDWRRFAATGLLASGLAGRLAALSLPGADEANSNSNSNSNSTANASATTITLPDPSLPWAMDTALGLARQTEQALATLNDTDEPWKRAQDQVTQDLQELQRALSALNAQASAQPNDFGFVVHLLWLNKPRRPDELGSLLQAEVAAQQGLLSAREQAVLENHLQSEIASQVQALMRGAAQRLAAINAELQLHPTSTGVRFRLLWQPLPEGQGAPAGLHAARERLLQTSAQLWSADERRAFGALLQQRIQDERRQLDAGALQDQLARALDYRQWHQFRVERWQDGQWRRLSGPASSGERALGLTVPLFAAVATFYSASPLAPRLILLDEAFAGIDDAARAHCMALVREFDLDFVITSEREWACYPSLPGVAICQLQRREGIDAVHVSRWAWDGIARRPDVAPGPRLAPAAPQLELGDLADLATPGGLAVQAAGPDLVDLAGPTGLTGPTDPSDPTTRHGDHA